MTIRSRLLFVSPVLRGFSFIVPKNCRHLETLAFEEVRLSEKPYNATAVILHGLLGSGRNWRVFARNLLSRISNHDSRRNWRIILVDLRNHGKSAEILSLNGSHDMESAAKDLANLVKYHSWISPDIIIGHSMGGKVALEFAESCARGDYGESISLPRQLWVLDSVPGEVMSDNSDGEVEKVLKTLKNLPYPPSRKWVVDYMIQLGFSKSLSEWIGSNLKGGENLTWAFNLEGAIQMFNSYRERNYWSLLENPPKNTEIILVQAENSDRWQPSVLQQLESLANRKQGPDHGKFSLHVLPNSGHWVHVDNPKGLLEILSPKIVSLP